VPQDEPLKLECQHFIDCIARGAKPITDGREGLRVLKVLKNAQRSLDMPSVASQFASQGRQHKQGTGEQGNDFFVHETRLFLMMAVR
jgi:UDP-2-acetamido-3-amino-2,3-dideoxy-glucuronate N-acetyltransferase